MSHIDSRRSPRIEVAGNLRIALIPALWPIHLADVSWGGFLVASPQAFPVDAVLTFEFSESDGSWTTELQASVVHCHLRTRPDGQAAEYVTGFKFAALGEPGVVEAVDALLDHAMADIEVDWNTVDQPDARR